MLDKVAWGSATPGQIIAPGLPNIKGKAHTSYDGHWTKTATNLTLEGCFYLPSDTPHLSGTTQGMGAYSSYGIAFNAALANSIYGNSETVQPPAYTVRYYIRALP